MTANLTPKTLATVCRPVEPGEDVRPLVADMEAILDQFPTGVGLAANQIGADVRVILIRTQELAGAIINPVITKRACGTFQSREGCLSFGLDRLATIERDKQITLEGLDINGEPVKRKLRGLAAAVIQHEIDHLEA